jgi:hypothetical protein
MALEDVAGAPPTAPDPSTGGPPSPPPGPGGGDAGPPGPPGGGPILAALQRRQMGPQISAPGPGNNADALVKLKNAIAMITSALDGLDAGSPPHKDALNALRALSRHVAQGPSSAGVQQTQLMDMLRGTVKNQLLQKIAQSQQGGGGPPGGSPPPPSTPLPGA